MTCKHPRPSWWLLYLLLPLMIGLLYLESQTPWTAGWHRAAQIGIVLITYDLVWLWLRANEGALLWEDLEKTRRSLDPDGDSQPNLVIWTFLEEETDDDDAD